MVGSTILLSCNALLRSASSEKRLPTILILSAEIEHLIIKYKKIIRIRSEKIRALKLKREAEARRRAAEAEKKRQEEEAARLEAERLRKLKEAEEAKRRAAKLGLGLPQALRKERIFMQRE